MFQVQDPLQGMAKATDGFDLLLQGIAMLPARERARTIEHFFRRADEFFREHDRREGEPYPSVKRAGVCAE